MSLRELKELLDPLPESISDVRASVALYIDFEPAHPPDQAHLVTAGDDPILISAEDNMLIINIDAQHRAFGVEIF
jgi:hypothetical protein